MSNSLPRQSGIHNKKRWIRFGDLYLPASILQQSRNPKYLPIVEAITAEEVLGKRGNEKTTIKSCRSMFWKDCILFASRISALLEKYGADDIELQGKLSQQLFKGDDGSRITTLLRSPRGAARRALFNSWQLLMFAKAVLLYGSDDNKQDLSDESRLQRVGNCLLSINDLIGLGSEGEMREDDTRLTEALIRNGAFFAREKAGNLLPRYYDLFLMLPKETDLKESPNYMDIEPTFRRITGFDLELFLALGFGIYSYYAAAKDFHIDKFVLNRRTFFSKTLVPDETTHKLLSLVSASRDQFRQQHIAKYGNSNLGNYFDFTFLRQRPLVRLDDNIYIPVDVRFLVERITAGIYWDIHDNLVGQERSRFQSFFGHILQAYLERLFRRVYPEPSATVRRAFYDTPYGGERASDTILFYGEEAVFIEVVVGRLRMEKTMISGDSEAFSEDISNKIVDAARQIDRVIRDFITGKLALPDWSPDNTKRYYPVVVTISPLPILLATYDMVRHMVADAGYLTSHHVADLEVASVGELELIEPLLERGHTLVEILKNKNRDKFYRRVPLWYYLHTMIDSKTVGTDSKYLRERTEEMFNQIRRLLFDVDVSRLENT
jgi:hypothetical protein